jgi:FtsH-binding integral membrane protein
MNTRNDQIKENMQKLSDEALAKIIETDVPQSAGEEIAESSAQSKKKDRFWGGFFLVGAAVFIYAAVLGVATIIVGKEHGMRMASDAPFKMIFYVALTAMCLWNGIKRRPRWASFLGITLAIIGIVAFSARFTLARGTGVSLEGEIVGKASLITGIILIVIGAICFLWELTRRKSAL